jgi:2-amino-4-hydroxy-6-hydroxymethyldihydropteridine diphosphokinase
MENVFLGLGSNVGKRIQFISQAVVRLMDLPATQLVKISSVYETEPVGVKNQGDFLNAVAWVVTTREAVQLYADIKAIEREIGRKKRARWGPREIDIDILIYGKMIVSEGPLIVPHPEMDKRNFVVIPLQEIAPALIHPLRQLPMREVARRCPDTARVTYSGQLTKELHSNIEKMAKRKVPRLEVKE